MNTNPLILKDALATPQGAPHYIGNIMVRGNLQEYGQFAEHYTDILEKQYGENGSRMGYCIGEAVQNMISHGNAQVVELHHWEWADAAAFTINGGNGFDLSSLAKRKASALEDARGRGLHIMKELADFLAFDHDGKGLYMYFRKGDA